MLKCSHCGSKDVLEQPYSIFCRKCGMDSMAPPRSKLDDMAYVSPASRYQPDFLQRYAWLIMMIVILIGAVVGYFIAKAM